MLKKIIKALPIATMLLTSLFSFAFAESENTPKNGLNVEVFKINPSNGLPLPQQQGYELCENAWTWVPNINHWFDGQYDGIVAGCRRDFVMVHYYGWITYGGQSGQTTDVVFDNISDDGFILDIDNQRVISNWNLQGCSGRAGEFQFENNKSYKIDAWFYEWGGGACNTLYWTDANGRNVVPTEAFSTQELVIQPYLNAPQNLTAQFDNGNVYLNWTAPNKSATTDVERYAVFFGTGDEGWGVATTETEITLSKEMFEQTGGLDALYYFKIRSDNDTDAIYSEFSNEVEVFVESPKIKCWDNSLVFNIFDCSEEPSPTPTESTETPTPTPTELTPEPTNSDSPTQSPEPTIVPSPTVVPPSNDPSPSQSTYEPEPSFSQTPTMQPSIVVPSDLPSPSESVTDVTNDVVPNDTTEEKVNQLIENLSPGEAVSAEAFAESGLDYSDLPPETPVELPNGVVLTAEIADAIQIFESPAEILGTVFTDPGKALKALGNVGADLPPKKRKKAQRAVFPMIIVGQIAASTTMTLMQRRVGR